MTDLSKLSYKELEQLQKQIEELKIAKNRETTNMMDVSGETKTKSDNTFTIAELEGMSQADYNKAKDAIKSGDAKIVDED